MKVQAREYAESRAFCSMLRYVSHAHDLIFMNFINTYLYTIAFHGTSWLNLPTAFLWGSQACFFPAFS